ncbi:MAG: hypothetical protein IT366_19405 [Candidatus Hydrogenedentes bacterium]|nr:hypothetical protein [Candidatus Hydrogenedentota bacterium]
MARYGKKAQESVEEAMHKRKRGELKSGRSGKTVKSRKQAIAIGLSEAREKGAKVPKKKASTKKRAASTTATRNSGGSKTGAKRSSAKRKSGPKKKAAAKSRSRR